MEGGWPQPPSDGVRAPRLERGFLTVSIVIPVLNAAAHLAGLARLLSAQKPVPPLEVVLVDSGSTDGTVALAEQLGFRTIPVSPFSHGRARNLGVRAARGDLVVLLTQDAEPADDEWLSRLTEPFRDPRVVGVYGRQVPRPDATPLECLFLTRCFPEGEIQIRHYPAGTPIGYEEAFFSNVNSAIRRSVGLEYPFDETLLMCEDQQFSRDVLRTGYAVAYAPEARVIHSHGYTVRQYFQRYFDSIVALRQVFGRRFGLGTSSRLGRSYVGREARTILRYHPGFFLQYVVRTMVRIAATLCALAAPVLPRRVCRRLSLHKAYWDTPEGNRRPKTGARRDTPVS
jgi:rhamnosyltransferase